MTTIQFNLPKTHLNHQVSARWTNGVPTHKSCHPNNMVAYAKINVDQLMSALADHMGQFQYTVENDCGEYVVEIERYMTHYATTQLAESAMNEMIEELNLRGDGRERRQPFFTGGQLWVHVPNLGPDGGWVKDDWGWWQIDDVDRLVTYLMARIGYHNRDRSRDDLKRYQPNLGADYWEAS